MELASLMLICQTRKQSCHCVILGDTWMLQIQSVSFPCCLTSPCGPAGFQLPLPASLGLYFFVQLQETSWCCNVSPLLFNQCENLESDVNSSKKRKHLLDWRKTKFGVDKSFLFLPNHPSTVAPYGELDVSYDTYLPINLKCLGLTSIDFVNLANPVGHNFNTYQNPLEV